MAVFTVDSDAVLQATGSAQASGERIRQEAASMVALLTRLQGAWTGGASAAFQANLEQWRALQRSVDEALVALSTALGAAGRHYAEAEQANAALFR